MPAHRLRHLLFTWLRTQGMDGALIRPYSGHASRQSLEIYSRLALTDAKRPTIKRSATFRSEDHPSLWLATRSEVPGRVEGGEHGDVAGPSQPPDRRGMLPAVRRARDRPAPGRPAAGYRPPQGRRPRAGSPARTGGPGASTPSGPGAARPSAGLRSPGPGRVRAASYRMATRWA